ncbi:MAG: PLP-dependent aminotransferase family protein [Thermoanaerobaculales bacterium]
MHIDRDSTVPIYLQISGGIKELILGGKLPEGFRLPPERRLARSLGVNRSTVLAAYRELKTDALVDAHVGRGTMVLPRQSEPSPAAPIQPIQWRQLAREGGPKAQDPLVRDLLELTERASIISLSVGLPAAELLPLDLVRRIMASLLEEVGAPLLLHSPTEGLSGFREAICQLLVARGIQCTPAEVLITSGSQQGLDLVSRVFLEPGDTVVVEEPSFFGALQIFRRVPVRLLGVPVDGEGMRTDMLEALLGRQRPKLIYTLPTFQNPSGSVMSLARRRHLLELAYRFQVPVLEDDPYADLRYDGAPLPSLAALDEHAHVLYLSSFSKVLFPGMRIGFVAAPRVAVRQLALAKQAMDLHSSTSGQFLLERFIRDGHYARHVKMVRGHYQRRRDFMDAALRREAPGDVSWIKPTGGFYFWCRFPNGIAQARLLAKAAEGGVSYLPGDTCFATEPSDNYLRLNFTFPAPEEIGEGVKRLMDAVRAVACKPRRAAGGDGGTPPIV